VTLVASPAVKRTATVRCVTVCLSLMTSTLKIAWKPVIRWWITPYWRSDVASVRFVLRSDGRYILADFLTFRPFVAVTRWHRVNLKTVWRYSYAIFLRLDSACNPVFTRSTLCLRGISCRPVSVCLSVTSRSSVEMAERIEMFLAQRPTSTLYPTHCATRKFWLASLTSTAQSDLGRVTSQSPH